MIKEETSEDITLYEVEQKVEDLYFYTKIKCDVVWLTLSHVCMAFWNTLLVVGVITLIQNPTVWKGIFCAIVSFIVCADIYLYLKETAVTYLDKVTNLRNNVRKFVNQETDTARKCDVEG